MISTVSLILFLSRSIAYLFIVWLGYRTPNKKISAGLMIIGTSAFSIGLFNTTSVSFGGTPQLRGLAANFFAIALVFAAIKIKSSVR